MKSVISKYEPEISGIAIATAGTVSNENDRIIGSTGNMFKEYPQTDFQSLTTLPVFLENDANAAAWAEYRVGASKGSSISVLLTLGTGVGGGIIINNKLLKGKSGGAGEMHFKMRTDKHRKCTCGTYDCYEAYDSGTGLRLTAVEISGNQDISTYDVIAGLEKQDELMIKIFNQWQADITDGIIGLANIFDPDCVVLSGSMAAYVNTDKIEKQVNSEIVTAPTKIRKATAGNYAGMIGVGLLALEAING
jgi:glucokinase